MQNAKCKMQNKFQEKLSKVGKWFETNKKIIDCFTYLI